MTTNMPLKHIDRQLIRGYLKAYLGFLACLVSLWIVVDLFTNLDDFTQGHRGLASVLKHIGVYYSYKVAQVFDRLAHLP